MFGGQWGLTTFSSLVVPCLFLDLDLGGEVGMSSVRSYILVEWSREVVLKRWVVVGWTTMDVIGYSIVVFCFE